jgi:hypothetical protein
MVTASITVVQFARKATAAAAGGKSPVPFPSKRSTTTAVGIKFDVTSPSGIGTNQDTMGGVATIALARSTGAEVDA